GPSAMYAGEDCFVWRLLLLQLFVESDRGLFEVLDAVGARHRNRLAQSLACLVQLPQLSQAERTVKQHRRGISRRLRYALRRTLEIGGPQVVQAEHYRCRFLLRLIIPPTRSRRLVEGVTQM